MSDFEIVCGRYYESNDFERVLVQVKDVREPKMDFDCVGTAPSRVRDYPTFLFHIHYQPTDNTPALPKQTVNEWPASTCVHCGRVIPSGQTQNCEENGGLCIWHVPTAVRKWVESLAPLPKQKRDWTPELVANLDELCEALESHAGFEDIECEGCTELIVQARALLAEMKRETEGK